MKILLITNGILMILALVQAVVGILFRRPGPALTTFFFQSLVLVCSFTLAVGFTFDHHLLCGWLFIGLFVYLFLIGFREWKRGH
jgi:hypothetical protein